MELLVALWFLAITAAVLGGDWLWYLMPWFWFY